MNIFLNKKAEEEQVGRFMTSFYLEKRHRKSAIDNTIDPHVRVLLIIVFCLMLFFQSPGHINYL